MRRENTTALQKRWRWSKRPDTALLLHLLPRWLWMNLRLIRQGTKFGVRLKATAPSIHMIRVDVESEFAPIIGTEKQSEELVRYLMQDFENDPIKVWDSDMFGRSLHSIVREGIQGKIAMMPDNARYKLQETLGRIINEGSGGLIAIIL